MVGGRRGLCFIQGTIVEGGRVLLLLEVSAERTSFFFLCSSYSLFIPRFDFNKAPALAYRVATRLLHLA